MNDVKAQDEVSPEQEPVAFKREERYIVIKRKHLADDEERRLRDFLFDLNQERRLRNFYLKLASIEAVAVESDWPEYETVWRMIEDRVTGRTRPASSPEAEVEAVALALINSDRAVHGYAPCSLRDVKADDVEAYKVRARAAIAALRGDAS